MVAAGIFVLALAAPSWSLGHALTRNSTDPVGARAVEWARSHHFGGIVTLAERQWYSHHQPPVGGTPKGGIPSPPQLALSRSEPSTTAASPTTTTTPARIAPLVANPLPGEGKWRPFGRAVDGTPAVWVTYLRPDATHTSLVAGVARLDMTRLTATLHAGTDLPGHGPWTQPPRIDPSRYPYVVAAFNSGFRLDSSRGGYYDDHRMLQPLVSGAASLVIYRDGRVDVGAWGRDDHMSASVVSVRQNLRLLVDGGNLVPGLANANTQAWGGTVGNAIYVWRSGVGIDAHGNLIYVGGPGLNVASLAELLHRAGCVRAMELDINTWWVSFTGYAPDGHGGVQAANLLPSMVRAPNRYLVTGTRDFFEIDAKH